MPVLWPPSSPLFGSRKRGAEAQLRTYAVYYDVFDETLAAGNVDGTDSTDTNAVREVYDTGSRLSLSNALVMTGVGSPLDPALWHTTTTPGPWEMWNAYAVLWRLRNDSASGDVELGLDTNLSGGIGSKPIRLQSEGLYVDGIGPLLAVPADSYVSVLMVRRPDSAGYFYLYRTGTNDWRLFWMDDGPLVTI